MPDVDVGDGFETRVAAAHELWAELEVAGPRAAAGCITALTRVQGVSETFIACCAALQVEMKAAAEGVGLNHQPAETATMLQVRIDRARDPRAARLRSLAAHIGAASARHHVRRTQEALEELRSRSAEELATAADLLPAPDLTGPTDGQRWMEWWWNLDQDAGELLLGSIDGLLTEFARFLSRIDREQWVPLANGMSVVVEPQIAVLPGPASTRPAANGSGNSKTLGVAPSTSVPPRAGLATSGQTRGEARPLARISFPLPVIGGSKGVSPPKEMDVSKGFEGLMSGLGVTSLSGDAPAATTAVASPSLSPTRAAGLVSVRPKPAAHPVHQADSVLAPSLPAPGSSALAEPLASPRVLPAAQAPPLVPLSTNPAFSASKSDLITKPVGEGSSKREVARDSKSASLAAVALPQEASPPLVASPEAHLPRAGIVEQSELTSFLAWRRNWHVDAAGRIASAPWLEPAFSDRALSALWAAITERRFAHAWTHARALSELGVGLGLDPDDVRSAGEIWARPKWGTNAADSRRPARIVELATADRRAALRLAVVLEALRPTPENGLASSEVSELVEAAEFRSVALERTVRELLRFAAVGGDAIEALHAARSTAAGVTTENLTERLNRARVDLRDLIRRKTSAAGGVIEHTHCRKGWDNFMADLAPRLLPLHDGRVFGADQLAAANRLVREIPKIHARHADRSAAKLYDRSRMNRVADELADAVRSVASAGRLLEVAPVRERATARLDLAPEVLAQLRNAVTEGDPVENLALALFQRVLVPPGESHEPGIDLTFRDFLGAPGLVPLVPAELLRDSTRGARLDAAIVAASELSEPVRVSAALFSWRPPDESDEPGAPAGEQLREVIQRTRPDLLGYLVAVASDRASNEGRASWEQLLRDRTAQVDTVREVWKSLEALGSPLAGPVGRACDEANSLESGTQGVGTAEPTLVRGWLDQVGAWARKAVVEGEGELRRIAEALESPAREAALAALREHRYADAHRLSSQHYPLPEQAVRATRWRADVEGQAKSLWELLEAERLEKTLREIITCWPNAGKDKAASNEALTRRFSQLLFGDLPPADWETQPVNALARASCTAIRNLLATQRQNPCFLPQLADFSRLVIAVAPERTSREDYPRKAADLAARHSGDLVVILAPGITPEQRTRTLSQMETRDLRAAVFDDVDLIRLFNPGQGERPNPLIAVIEMALEQQPLTTVDPFRPHEGQHVRMEMYVGRKGEAADLASRATYSRLFSGRKLGKSALLRYVESAVEKRLPSGNSLRVVYVPVPGVRTDAAFAASVLDQVDRTLHHKAQIDPAHAADGLLDALRGLVDARLGESFLFVLDEADVFVESQLEAYEVHREACLSFRLSRELESIHDAQGLPRIRFVFSGYRTTNTVDGAWRNWGKVLVLDPLKPEDAARLISGPLARLGVDARSQAAQIAFRCGYQPAVLIAFGHHLVREELANLGRRRGKTPEVTPDMVARVFNLPAVQEEILSVVANNFQGNDIGQIVFDAVLLVMMSLPPGAVVTDLAVRVIGKIRELGAEELLRTSEGGAPEIRVEVALRDLAARKLLIETRTAGVAQHRFQFPHLLPVLLRRNPEQQIRERAVATEVARPGGVVDASRSLLGRSHLAELRDLFTGDLADLDIGLAVLGSNWEEGVADSTGGIADQLGLPTTREPSDLSRSIAITGLDFSRAAKVRDATSVGGPTQLLLGGPGLLRWAIAARASEGRGIEVVGLGRLSPARHAWWFGRVRALEFAARDAQRRIFDLTRGIPLLVGLLDHVLAPEGARGETLTAEELRRRILKYGQLRRARVREHLRLDTRELQILRIATGASEHATEGDSLVDASETFAESLATAGEPITDADVPSLELLVRLGLLPELAEATAWIGRAGVPSRDDPLHAILADAGAE